MKMKKLNPTKEKLVSLRRHTLYVCTVCGKWDGSMIRMQVSTSETNKNEMLRIKSFESVAFEYYFGFQLNLLRRCAGAQLI